LILLSLCAPRARAREDKEASSRGNPLPRQERMDCNGVSFTLLRAAPPRLRKLPVTALRSSTSTFAALHPPVDQTEGTKQFSRHEICLRGPRKPWGFLN